VTIGYVNPTHLVHAHEAGVVPAREGPRPPRQRQHLVGVGGHDVCTRVQAVPGRGGTPRGRAGGNAGRCVLVGLPRTEGLTRLL
jgi:hypothetical protein